MKIRIQPKIFAAYVNALKTYGMLANLRSNSKETRKAYIYTRTMYASYMKFIFHFPFILDVFSLHNIGPD